MWLDLVDFPWLELLRPDDLLQTTTSLLSLGIVILTLPGKYVQTILYLRGSRHRAEVGETKYHSKISWRKK